MATSTSGVTLCADKGAGLTYSATATCPGKTTAIVVAGNTVNTTFGASP